MSTRFYKDADAVLDFSVDWSGWLASGESLSTSTFTVDAGITKDSESNDTSSATVWLSGGTAGTSYTVTNQITTSAGRTDERSMTIAVIDR